MPLSKEITNMIETDVKKAIEFADWVDSIYLDTTIPIEVRSKLVDGAYVARMFNSTADLLMGTIQDQDEIINDLKK